ncbi:MAG: hypothetical protein ACI8PB_003416 [Desulforhopalus sp.]
MWGAYATNIDSLQQVSDAGNIWATSILDETKINAEIEKAKLETTKQLAAKDNAALLKLAA